MAHGVRLRQVGAEVDWIGKAVTDAIGCVDGKRRAKRIDVAKPGIGGEAAP
jgi:hypothetical protein